MNSSIDTQKQQLSDALAMLENAGIIDFNGHYSCRLPDNEGFLINSGASVRSAMTPDDIIAVDFNGTPLAGEASPPMEFHIHSEIYKARPDVQSVVHTHPLWSTLLSMTGHQIKPVIMQAALLGEVQYFDETMSINRQPLGERLAQALGEHAVICMKSHGAVVATEGILETFVLSVYLEETAQRLYQTLPIGQAYELSDEERALIRKNLWKRNLFEKVWNYYHAKLKR